MNYNYFNQLVTFINYLKIYRTKWFEKYYHGLYWCSGFREYNKLKDVLRGCYIAGNIYVRGIEKRLFVTDLLSDLKVNIINIEELGCPNLSIIRN